VQIGLGVLKSEQSRSGFIFWSNSYIYIFIHQNGSTQKENTNIKQKAV